MSAAHGATAQAVPLLEVDGVTKQFFGNVVVDAVSFTVGRGEIVALLGENGAGKSTVIKMLAGVYSRDGGRLAVEGRDLDEPGVRDRISFIHQDLGLVEWMTVAENVALSMGFPRNRFGLVSWASVRDRAEGALALVGGGIDPETRVFDLTRTEKSLLAIARALVSEPAVLVLDEPTASLPQADVERLFEVLRALQERGVGMIYVSHRLDEIYQIADRVVVMRNGRRVGDAPVTEVPPELLVELIVGHATRSISRADVGDGVVLQLHGLTAGDVGPVDLTLRSGEVVGLVGLRGAGQAEVGRAVAGAVRTTAGTMSLDGTAFVPRTTTAAVQAGVGFATSNRESEGVAAGLSVRENMFLNPGVWGRPMTRLSGQRREKAAARELVQRFGVRPGDPEVAADTLSGGNQQKVVLARWFGVGRRVVVLEEPTMGVDVGAKADIYALLKEACEDGTAALVISTDFEEVAAICHRALVFGRGRVSAELTGEDLTVPALLAAASDLPAPPADQSAVPPSEESR